MREELLAVPGVAGAEFEGDPTGPAGVKVQLAPGADADDVGREVRRVLAGHGMRSQLTAPAIAPRQAPPPPEPRKVINLAEFDHGPGGLVETIADAEPDDTAESPPSLEPAADVEPEAAAAAPPEPELEAGPAPSDDAVDEPQADTDDDWVPVLGDVGMTQRGSRVTVSVAGGGRVARRVAVASSESIDRALLDAVSELLGVTPVPALVSLETVEQSGSPIISVLVDDGSAPRAGSAVQRGSRAWAVAKAFWSALSGPA
jgi:hypothetical protein